jgi:N6-adenosine-specific RNA methylase IME4
MPGGSSGKSRASSLDRLPRGHFGAIVADPPWDFSGNSVARPGKNARRHYACMSPAEIAWLPRVGELPARDCWLFLWITAPFLAAGAHAQIFAAWGFRVSTIGFTWIKRTASGGLFCGMGYTTRANPEFVVVGRRGQPARASASVHSVIEAPLREHSRKPDELYARVEALVGGAPKLELFARERRPGWTSWGDELGKWEPAA